MNLNRRRNTHDQPASMDFTSYTSSAPPPNPYSGATSYTEGSVENGMDHRASVLSDQSDILSASPMPVGRSLTEPSPAMSSSQLRFQSAVKKIISIQKSTSSKNYIWSTGDEPGVNPHRDDYSHLNDPVVIEVADFDREQLRHEVLDNQKFIKWLLDKPRPIWAKVRWININGMSWDVLKAVSIKYGLHPLAIEDTLHTGATRPKADFFEQHLFLNMLLHTVIPSSDPLSDVNTNYLAQSPKRKSLRERFSSLFSPSRIQLDTADFEREAEGVVDPDSPMHAGPEQLGQGIGIGRKGRFRNEKVHEEDQGTPRQQNIVVDKTIRHLTKDFKVPVGSAQMNVFLTRDGTIISFFQKGAAHLIAPLFNRLRSPHSTLRMCEDPSMVLHNLLDVVADQALEIVESFRREIMILEGQVLVKPEASTVRHLHVLSAELLLLKRTMSPVAALVHKLQNHLMHDAVTFQTVRDRKKDKETSSDTILKTKAGFISRETEVYLTDVADHIDSVLSSVDLFTALSQNLVDFTFNMINYNSSQSTIVLTTVTVIFLPLTFWTGYLGMNFQKFPGVLGPTDSPDLFWSIAVPFSVAFIICFNFAWLYNKLETVKRVWQSERFRRSAAKRR
ncbi:hypothetical protein BT69DRAFT_1284743 [Atractiella rhizophila]|nr:hypothetical protein BT69DRAFT_1284743 [Atractiella rhizophila]